jgi:hypothetical protein
MSALRSSSDNFRVTHSGGSSVRRRKNSAERYQGYRAQRSNRDPTILGAKPKRSENRTIIRLLCSWLLERGLGPMRSLHRHLGCEGSHFCL